MKSAYEPVAIKDDAGPSAAPPERVSGGGITGLQVEPGPATNRASQVAQLGAACLAWLAASSGIIVVNRYIMRELGFSFPMALSAMGQCTSFLFSWLICDGLRLVPPPPDAVDTQFFLTRIAPVGAAQGIGMWLSNNLYLLLTVAFIEMARAALPLFTLLGLWLVRIEIPTWEHIQAVSLTGIGCGISAFGEVALSFSGLLCLAGNFVLEVTRMVMLQFLMQGHNLNPWQGLKLMTLPAGTMLILMSMALESKEMASKGAVSIILTHPLEFTVACTLGLAVNWLSNLVIKISSATTVKLLAAVRGPLVVLCGVMLFSETVNAMQFVGYSIALCGFVWFNIAKARTPPAPAHRP